MHLIHLHSDPFYTVHIQSHINALHSLTCAQTPSAKPLITNMLIFTLHVYPDKSIQLIQQLPDLDLKLTLTDRAPASGHAHFTACVQACSAFILFACTVSIKVAMHAGAFLMH